MPLAPRGFLRFCRTGLVCLFLPVLRKISLVLLIGGSPIGAQRLRNGCGLADRHAMPALGKGGRIERITQLGRRLLCTEERDVLLTEGEIDRGKRVEGGQFARVALNQTNMRHRSSDQVGLSHRDMLFFLALLALLVHQGATPARTAIRHSLHQGNEPSNRPFPPLRNLFFYVVCKAAIRFSGSTPLKVCGACSMRASIQPVMRPAFQKEGTQGACKVIMR